MIVFNKIGNCLTKLVKRKNSYKINYFYEEGPIFLN